MLVKCPRTEESDLTYLSDFLRGKGTWGDVGLRVGRPCSVNIIVWDRDCSVLGLVDFGHW